MMERPTLNSITTVAGRAYYEESNPNKETDRREVC